MVKEEKRIVLTKPISFDGDSNANFKVPNITQRVLSIFTNVRPGTDLTKFEVPAIFNLPKSHLQCLGESVYCINNDLLSKCNMLENPIDRFTSVVAWIISIPRPVIFGLGPYNPILGETHHVSRGNLNVLLEQVSHHPPVTAFHATDEKENVEIIWCQHAVPKFCGASVEVEMYGKRQLKLHNHGETYEMNTPKLCIRCLPVPRAEWVGNVRIKCKESGLEAELCFKANSLIGFRGNHRAVKGKIYNSSSSRVLYEIDGHWDRTVTTKDINNGKITVIYNAKEVLSGLKSPIVKNLQEVWPSESVSVWSEVSQYILTKDWGRATEAKKAVEEKQRKLLRERESAGETWVPKHFNVTYSKENGWDCSPIQKFVSPAPIVVPL